MADINHGDAQSVMGFVLECMTRLPLKDQIQFRRELRAIEAESVEIQIDPDGRKYAIIAPPVFRLMEKYGFLEHISIGA